MAANLYGEGVSGNRQKALVNNRMDRCSYTVVNQQGRFPREETFPRSHIISRIIMA
jgi:hypothetical protein